MLRSEIMERYGHDMFEWIQLKKPNYIEDENGEKLDFGPRNGWQSWSGKLMMEKDEDGNDTSEYSMVWIPYWGDNNEEGAPHDLFEKFYRATLSDGSTAVCGGYICNEKYEKLYDYVDVPIEKPVVNEETGEEEIVIEDTTELQEVGEVLVDFDFCEEEYNRYIEMQPSRVPDVVANLCSTSDNNVVEKLNAGSVPNSVQATFLAIDGTEVTEPVAFKYSEANREALRSAVLKVTSGASSARVTFDDSVMGVRLNREQVLRLYLEMETYSLMLKNRNIAYKAMVMAHKDDDKHQANYLESHYANPEMELEPQYQEMFENLMDEDMQDLQEMNENWGLDV